MLFVCVDLVPADLSFRVCPLYFTGYAQFNPPIAAIALRLYGISIFVLTLEKPNNYLCNIFIITVLTLKFPLPVYFVCRSRRYSQECVYGV